MASRQQRAERGHEETEHRQRQRKQQQRQGVVGRGQVGRHAQRGVEPAARGQPTEQRQAEQAEREHGRDALEYVAVLEVAEFVSQHGLDLRHRELGEQRVEEHHALGRAEPGEVGVAMGRPATAVHHEQALGGESAALHQRLHPRLQRLVGERLELVEQRRDDGGVEHQDQQVEHAPGAPRPQPPPRARRGHDPQHQRRQRQPDQRPDGSALGQICEPQPHAGAVEAEALFDAERAPPFERQIDHGAHDREGDQQRELVGQAAETRRDRVAHHGVERVQATQQRPAQHDGRRHGADEQAEARFGHGVVGRLAVRVERHAFGKGRGHRVAMPRHVLQLARGQPELDCQRSHQRRGEEQGQGMERHAAQCRAATMPA